MNIGKLYTVKKWFWLIFPTKETAATLCGHAVRLGAATAAATHTAWYSKRYNCEVSYFSPDSIVVFLEEDGIYKKFLTTDGKIGWTWFGKGASCNDCFEEVKTQ